MGLHTWEALWSNAYHAAAAKEASNEMEMWY
jgi:hypothetical protein